MAKLGDHAVVLGASMARLLVEPLDATIPSRIYHGRASVAHNLRRSGRWTPAAAQTRPRRYVGMHAE
jgi:hypothetical protein